MPRVLPHNLEAEQSILGCILMDPELQSELLTELNEDDFYEESHKNIFGAMREIYNKGKPIDFITLSDKLENMAKLDAVGGMAYLSEIANIVPSAANHRFYSEIVRRDSVLRKLIRSANKIIEDSYASDDSDGSLSMAEKLIYDISAEHDTSSLNPINNSFDDIIKEFEEINKDASAHAGLRSGFKEMDSFTNGFRKGNLIILAARPSNGKTTLAMNIVENAALQSGAVCAVFALEMTTAELAKRMLCSISGVSNNDATRGNLDENSWAKLWAARKKLASAKIFVDDTSITTPAEILSKCRRLKSKNGLDLIVVDHIQLMEVAKGGVKRGDNRQQEITEISRNLKMIAKELDVPVIALSQLSRLVTGRKGQRPMLSDLRESGAIEQDADIVMFIHRPDKVMEAEDTGTSGNKNAVMKNVAEILVEKNRAGEVGSFKLLFKGDNTKFVDLPAGYSHPEQREERPQRSHGEPAPIDEASLYGLPTDMPPAPDVPPDEEIPPAEEFFNIE